MPMINRTITKAKAKIIFNKIARIMMVKKRKSTNKTKTQKVKNRNKKKIIKINLTKTIIKYCKVKIL